MNRGERKASDGIDECRACQRGCWSTSSVPDPSQPAVAAVGVMDVSLGDRYSEL